MTSLRLTLAAVVLSTMFVGCSQAPEKEMPKVTPAQQAELDKSHAEMKAKAESGGTPAPAAPTK